MTKFVKKSEINNNWYEIDASNAVVGRLASVISKIIRGKNKTTYTPHMDNGDFVIVKNIEKIKFTGKKFQNKKYFKHTGYPGGIKETTPEKLFVKKPSMKGVLKNCKDVPCEITTFEETNANDIGCAKVKVAILHGRS